MEGMWACERYQRSQGRSVWMREMRIEDRLEDVMEVRIGKGVERCYFHLC